MGIETAMIVAATAAAVGTGYSVYSGEQQRKQQNQALDMQRQGQAQALADSQAQAKSSEEAMNKANRKSPDMGAVMQMAGRDKQSSTMLTGPGGVNPNEMAMGKNTLLGG